MDAPLHSTTNLLLESPCLSILEKYLLRKGWRVENFTAPHDGRYMTRALPPFAEGWISYPHPAYHYHGQDRTAELRDTLNDLARVLARQGRGSTPASLSLEIIAAVTAPFPDFLCRQCGLCCDRMADAYQGRVSVEEVRAWERLGLKRILRFVRRVERPEYTLYKAWVHPLTGRYLPRCPWLARPRDGRRLCRIHAYRPFKCRSFPLQREQAERVACPGVRPRMEPVPDTDLESDFLDA